eukprot:SAG11_NODE_8547_length_1002_cov_1.467331_1_plen_80_part_00
MLDLVYEEPMYILVVVPSVDMVAAAGGPRGGRLLSRLLRALVDSVLTRAKPGDAVKAVSIFTRSSQAQALCETGRKGDP